MPSNLKIKYLFLLILVSSFHLFTSCENEGTTKQETVKQKPNVILIITDDQGYGDLACHGNPFVQTPHLDAFHKESIRLTNFHVSPTCAPTRAALMTGRYNNRTGVWHTIAGWSLLRENEKTLANMFSEAGYKTGAFGKWHLGDNYPFRPFDRGFQETVMHAGGGVQQTPDYWNNDYFDDTYFKNGLPQKYNGYCTDVFFEEARSFIKNCQVTKEKIPPPFFCYIATNAPHWPFNVPLEYIEPYKKHSDNLMDHQQRFLGMITNIDDNFGKLRQELQDLKIADNTLLIFMSDNGTAAGIQNKDGKTYGYNAGMRGTKNHPYDGGHRVPFFIHWKNGNLYGGKDISEISAHIDVLPTLAELCEIELPKDHLPIDGSSLAPLLLNENTTWEERILITDSQRKQVPEKWLKTAVMTNRWRLVNGKELFDIQKDPGQQEDIAQQFPNEVNFLRMAYNDWWANTSTHFAEEPLIKIGTSFENPVALTAHDWHTIDQEIPWNQLNIRAGKKGNISDAYWSIEVMKAGIYHIKLSRYPLESELSINATTHGILVNEFPALDGDIPIGEALKFKRARIELDGKIIAEQKVDNRQKAVLFEVSLPEGFNKLSAFFTLENEVDLGAYYVYVEQVDQ